MQPLTVGIVGYGYWGPNLARNFNDDNRVEVKYICDPSPAMLDKHRKRYQSTIFTTNYDDLLNDKKLQAIAIATPVDTHYDVAKKALLAGKHVLVEKPMCQNSRQCSDLIAIAEQNGLTLMVDHTFIYHGPVRLIKQMLDHEDLGNLLYFNSVRINLGIFQSDINVLWDLGAHDLSIMDFLLARSPTSVHAIGASHVGNGIEDIAYLTLNFEDNLIAHFQVSWLSPVKLRQILVGGSKKMVVFDDSSQTEKVRVYDKGIDTMHTPETAQERYRNLIQYRHGDMHAPVYDLTEALRTEIRHFVDCVQMRETPLSDGYAGWRVVQMLELADLSLRTGQLQPVPKQGLGVR